VNTIYQHLPLGKIIDHPINHAIYQDNFDDDLVESVRVNGVLNPITVCRHPGGSFVCLSGHRRRQAAKLAGLTNIPAMVVRDEVPEHLQVIMVIESNRQRDKTTEQKARETAELAKARSVEAKSRMKAGKKATSDPRANLPEGSDEKGRAITQAAKETGLGSRKTAEKALEVVEKIDELTAAGEAIKAEQLREALNEKSVSAAARLAEEIDKPQPQPEPEKASEPEVVDQVRDEFGAVWLSLVPLWEQLSKIRETESLVRQLKKRFKAHRREPVGSRINTTPVDAAIQAIEQALKLGPPHTECFKCQRDIKPDCKLCRGTGWINKSEYSGHRTESGDQWLRGRDS
jgi:ParB-like chromosome segregation protein Spo0J